MGCAGWGMDKLGGVASLSGRPEMASAGLGSVGPDWSGLVWNIWQGTGLGWLTRLADSRGLAALAG